MEEGAYVVLDVGKTLSKVSLWSRSGNLIDRQVRPNQSVVVDGIRRLDSSGIADWLLPALGRYKDHPVEAIVPVGHGAGVVAVEDGRLVAAPFDYEQALPGPIAETYADERDPFAACGSPALPNGLNLGAQVFWMETIHGPRFRNFTLLPWAQYWSWFLSGVAVSEATSLGCHTDLWNPSHSTFSAMAKRRGWAELFAPLACAGATVGHLRAEIAEATGLPTSARILAGLHDSNAALLAARGFPEIASAEATVLSTGTWFIAMRLPACEVDLESLPEGRDCLVNIDVYGKPVPSARFMGGREIEALIEIDTRRVDIKPDQPALLQAVPEIIAMQSMMLPTLARGCGPFPAGRAEWVNRPQDWYGRRAAACLYAALVANASLDLIGASENLLIEGRFAEAEVFVRALAALRPETKVYTANAHNDVSFGALRLLDPALRPQGHLVRVQPLQEDLTAYRKRWATVAERGK